MQLGDFLLYSGLMTSENSSNRLVALDGIRGIAIIFVILNHIPLGVLFTVLPSWTFPLLTLMTVNGKTAVSLLFLLSGFLMTWLYPQPKKAIDFWSKRYARIFPPFLVMVLSLALIRSFKLFLPVPLQIQMTLQPWIYAALSVPIVLTMAVLGRFLWKSGVALNQKLPIGKLAIWGFLAFQLGVAAWYSLILLRVPPAEFYLKWSQTSQMIATTVVNATLTFPFGNYIAQLDGVYWSLITEVAFYLLYPVLIVPLIGAVLQRKSWKYSALLFLAFLPFLFGLKLVFERVLRW
jgi:peptidoglycan/LPS O-acetylase OafA/YrhL